MKCAFKEKQYADNEQDRISEREIESNEIQSNSINISKYFRDISTKNWLTVLLSFAMCTSLGITGCSGNTKVDKNAIAKKELAAAELRLQKKMEEEQKRIEKNNLDPRNSVLPWVIPRERRDDEYFYEGEEESENEEKYLAEVEKELQEHHELTPYNACITVYQLYLANSYAYWTEDFQYYDKVTSKKCEACQRYRKTTENFLKPYMDIETESPEFECKNTFIGREEDAGKIRVDYLVTTAPVYLSQGDSQLFGKIEENTAEMTAITTIENGHVAVIKINPTSDYK